MKSKKLLSLLLAVMMMLSVVPFYASAATMLTPVNTEIVVPSVSPAEINYGQTLSDLTLTGGEMWYKDSSGTKIQIEGYFTIFNANFAPAATDAYSLMLQFVPTDTNYTCPAVFRDAAITTYTGTWPTIKIKAEAVATLAEAPVASTIVGGFQLQYSKLSGGKIVDAEGNDITASGTWSWVEDPIVTENSSYTAKWTSKNNDYNPITVDIPVPLAYTMVTKPTLASDKYEFYKGISTDDFEIVPGVAKTPDGTEDVPGTYTFESKSIYAVTGQTSKAIIFTPDDESLPTSRFSVFFEIVKGPIKFVDENGAETVPVVTVPYGTKIDYQFISAYLKDLKTNAESINVDFSGAGGSGNLEGWNTWPAVGEHEFTARLTSYNSNYAESFAKFKLVVEPRAISVTSVSYLSNGELIRIKTDYSSAPGTYDVYVDGSLVGSALEYGSYGVDCSWKPEVSGTYNVKVVYNPAENDSSDMEDYETEITVAVARDLTTEGLSSSLRVNGRLIYSTTTIVNGDEISLECTNDNFNGWEITDTDGNPVDVGEIKTVVDLNDDPSIYQEGIVAGDLTCTRIIFTMPDYDIIVKAKSTLDEEETPDDGGDDTTGDDTDDGNGGLDIDNIFGDLTEGDSDNAILNIFNNIIAWFKNIIETIKGFFRAIGDAT